METAAAALERLCDPASEVSAHYLIGEDGTVCRLVAEERRAWHAGAGAWGVLSDINSHSIGIELANPGDRPFPEAQTAALEALLRELMARHDIPPKGVIAHADLAPGRKSDPGPRFDWRRLALAGCAVWAEAAGGPERPVDRARFARAAAQFGYPVRMVGISPVLAAFRLRFRPWASGPLDHLDIGVAEALAPRWPGPGRG
ncbi:MAG: N-acetylmuramoyl-L-alanine amidase [Alphaproteobacteria bacterium]|nr:MAG: N-acetylmuramoyl-L-alanine amidase [Alphaproteobacteria bacterium]